MRGSEGLFYFNRQITASSSSHAILLQMGKCFHFRIQLLLKAAEHLRRPFNAFAQSSFSFPSSSFIVLATEQLKEMTRTAMKGRTKERPPSSCSCSPDKTVRNYCPMSDVVSFHSSTNHHPQHPESLIIVAVKRHYTTRPLPSATFFPPTPRRPLWAPPQTKKGLWKLELLLSYSST